MQSSTTRDRKRKKQNNPQLTSEEVQFSPPVPSTLPSSKCAWENLRGKKLSRRQKAEVTEKTAATRNNYANFGGKTILGHRIVSGKNYRTPNVSAISPVVTRYRTIDSANRWTNRAYKRPHLHNIRETGTRTNDYFIPTTAASIPKTKRYGSKTFLLEHLLHSHF